jgi:hypothetical protein
LTAKFGWNEKEKTVNLSLIGSAAIASLMIAALICGKLMQQGRLKVLNLACIVGIIGLLLM